MRFDLLPISLAAIAFTGCQSASEPPVEDGPRPSPIESAPAAAAVAPSAEVLPASETLAYAGTIRVWKDGVVQHTTPAPSLSARIETVDGQRRISIDGAAGMRGAVRTDAAGRVDAAESKFPVGLDLIEQLPPPSTPIELGKTWVSEPPPDGYVRANADADKLTMTDAVYSTPTAIWTVDGLTVVRLDTVARHRISFLDEGSRQIRSVELGLSYLGVTDLVQAPGGGWRVLQFTRLVPMAEIPPDTTIAQLRAGDRVEFTACAAQSSRLDLRSLRRRGTTAVPELAACNL